MKGGFWFIVGLGAVLGIWFNASNILPSAGPAPEGSAPVVVGMGQHLAVQTLGDAHWQVTAHDTYGRNRDGDDLEWIVCAQHTRSTKDHVDLAVARIAEGCPAAPVDRGTPHPVRVGGTMPDLVTPVGRTGYMVTRDFPDASLIFTHQNREISEGLEDYKVCTQSRPAGSTWDGEPLTFTLSRYEDAC